MDAKSVQEDVGSLPIETVGADLAVGPDLKVGSYEREGPVRQRAAGTRALTLPLACTLGLAAFLFLDSVRHNMSLVWAFAGAAAVLLAWNGAVLASAVRRGRVPMRARARK